jgi:hypothetical protein
MTSLKNRPFGITALIALFLFGTAASFLAALSLTFPGSFLDPIWRLNPHARAGFNSMGSWAIVLMSAVCVACAFTAIGLWRGSRWGYWLAVLMLVVNLVGELVNVISGIEPRAIFGIPIVLLVLVYMMRRRTRSFFSQEAHDLVAGARRESN